MNDSAIVAAALVLAGFVEAWNGYAFAIRGKKTLRSAGLAYHEGPGLVIQEFGVYSIAIGFAYLLAIFDPIRRPGIVLVGIIINTAAAGMHLARSAGIHFGGTTPGMSARSERNQGLVHVFSIAVLGVALLASWEPSF